VRVFWTEAQHQRPYLCLKIVIYLKKSLVYFSYHLWIILFLSSALSPSSSSEIFSCCEKPLRSNCCLATKEKSALADLDSNFSRRIQLTFSEARSVFRRWNTNQRWERDTPAVGPPLFAEKKIETIFWQNQRSFLVPLFCQISEWTIHF